MLAVAVPAVSVLAVAVLAELAGEVRVGVLACQGLGGGVRCQQGGELGDVLSIHCDRSRSVDPENLTSVTSLRSRLERFITRLLRMCLL